MNKENQGWEGWGDSLSPPGILINYFLLSLTPVVSLLSSHLYFKENHYMVKSDSTAGWPECHSQE